MIEVHGERFHARLWWDDRDRDPEQHGWYIEYLTKAGDCVDDSVKVWHPPVLEAESEVEAVKAIAVAYLAKLEKDMS
jgi:hypothetical protein